MLRGLPKTLVFNLRCFPFRQAIRLPVLVSHRVALYDLSGELTIRSPLRTGMILLGFGQVGVFDYRRSRAVWEVAGEVVFDGPARLGNGFKLSVAESGTVTFGPEFVLSAESQIVCRQSIAFGRGCLVSWDVLILDTDFHSMAPLDGPPTPSDAPVVIGDRVWLGARATVVKGASLASDLVVAAGSVVTGSVEQSNAIVGGNPATVLRTDVQWHHS